MGERYILINEEICEKIFTEFAEIKLLLKGSTNHVNSSDDVLMDTASLIEYFKLDRRTIYNYRRHKGMPFHRAQNGRIYYWKSEIDAFFGKSKCTTNV